MCCVCVLVLDDCLYSIPVFGAYHEEVLCCGKRAEVDVAYLIVILSGHYGFTEEELDFIINYDIKYRMGDELNEE